MPVYRLRLSASGSFVVEDINTTMTVPSLKTCEEIARCWTTVRFLSPTKRKLAVVCLNVTHSENDGVVGGS